MFNPTIKTSGVSFLTVVQIVFRVSLPSLLLTSCAFQTFDVGTGTAHLWGVGHLAMGVRPAEDAPQMQAVTVASDTVGVAADGTPGTSGGGLGWRGTQVSYMITEAETLTVDRQPGSVAMHRVDDGGTAHLWGAGHLSLSTGQPLKPERVEAVIAASDTLGAGVGTGLFSSGLSLGWRSSRMAYLNHQSTSMRIVRPHRRGFSFTRHFAPQASAR
jgi:hypothetical protein